MSTSPVIRSDHEIQTAVQDELEWTPDVDAARIGVAVEDRTVTLSGEVEDLAERRAATHAALRVRSVSAVANDLTVHPKSEWPVTETGIAKEVERALRRSTIVPDTVKAEIRGHHVTLSGQVRWHFQRQAAEDGVQYLRGVYSVDNMITLNPRPFAADAERRIIEALLRNAQLDPDHITVAVAGTTATLTGSVRSWAEKRQAGQAAWASPHITEVENGIRVRPH